MSELVINDLEDPEVNSLLSIGGLSLPNFNKKLDIPFNSFYVNTKDQHKDNKRTSSQVISLIY